MWEHKEGDRKIIIIIMYIKYIYITIYLVCIFIVNNDNMNTFYNIVKLIEDRVKENPLVNTVIFARTEDSDLYKKKLFPLVHINPVAIPYKNAQTRRYVFEVGVFDIRDFVSETTDTYFEGNDNLIDNMSTTDAILNDLTSYLENQNNEFDIELVSVSDAIPLVFKNTNILDGWVVKITLEAPNTVIATC